MPESLSGLADIGILSASQHRINRPIPVPPKRTFIKPGQKLELDLTPAERKTILDHLLCLPPEYESLLKKTRPEEPLLLTLDDLEDLSGYVAAEANHTSNKKVGKILDSAFTKMESMLDRFTDEEPVVTRPTAATRPKKPTKKSVAAQKAFEQWRETSADQAAFLVAWASTFLRQAEQKKHQHETLASFVPNELDRVVLSTLPGVEPKIQKRFAAGKTEFTRAELCGMVMAIATELVKAPAHRQVGLMMVAMTIMAAMQAKPGDPLPHVEVKKSRPVARRSKPAKKAVKKPAKAKKAAGTRRA